MRRKGQRRSQHMTTMAELNVTPMLDLAFVLLIIFMITAPLLASRVDLIIPTTRAKRDAIPSDRTLIIEMNKDAQLEVEGDVLTTDELTQRIGTEQEKHPEIGVLIRADGGLNLSQVMPILDLLKSQDVVDVGFMARSDP